MRSPLITITVPELGGGIGRNIVNLSNEFLSLGFRVHVLTDTLKGPYFSLFNEGVGVFTLGTSHVIGGLPRFSAYLCQHKPTAVLTPVVRHTILALRAKWLTGSHTRVFARVHNTYSIAFSPLREKKRSKRIKALKKYYPRCDAVIAVSKGVAEDFCRLTRFPLDRMTTIYNPMVNNRISLLADQEPDHPWFAQGLPPVILGVGRLTPQKNFPLLMEAFDIVRSRTPCRLVIIGDGLLRETLLKMAASSPFKEDISLPGHRINPFSFMKRAAVFVLSSSWEGFGNVLVEAMATGTPVVSTDCPHGPREILANGKYGPLVPPEKPEELAGAILGLLENPTPGELLQEGAKRFSARAIAGRYLEVFGLLTEPGREKPGKRPATGQTTQP